MSGNELRLSARVIARDTLRHTPAGVPILMLTLGHESRQLEAGVPRQVGFEIEAMAVGHLARSMDALQTGASVQVTGFLATRSKLSRRIMLHVNEFEIK